MSHFLDLSLLKRNRNFRFLYTGQFVSLIGTMISMVALPYQIYQQTQSSLMVGLLSLAQLAPLLFTALLGGVFADRYHRQKLLIYSESFLALGCLFLVFNALQNTPSISLIFIVASMMSAITGLHRPALESILQQIVNKSDFAAAGALTTFRFSACMIIGPTIGGLLIAQLGLIWTYSLDFISFAFSVLTIALIRHDFTPSSKINQHPITALKEGILYATKRPELLGSYLVDFLAMILGMPMALFPAIAQKYGGPQLLGLMYAAPAIGALIISIWSGWTARIKRYGVAIALSAALWGIAIIGFGLSPNFYLAFIFLVLSGLFDTISTIFRMILWNENISQEFRGRMAGIEMLSYLGGPKLGNTRAGMIAALFGVTFSVVSGGALCVISVIISCYFLPKFWRYRKNIEKA